MVKNGGYYIHYPDIRKTAQFISADGVHLTALGNGIFDRIAKILLHEIEF
jgi:hypothetical protein